MKNVRLGAMRPPRDPGSPYTQHHLYSVLLGNRRTVLFSSERAAAAYAAETDRWISAHLHAANFLLAEAFTAYRGAWCLMDQAKVPNIDARSRELLQDCWSALDNAIARGGGENGWAIAWKWFAQAVEALRQLAIMLRDLYRSRNNPVERARMELLLTRATAIATELSQYGSDVKGAEKIVVL